MFCKNCGSDVGENKFCANCGTAVADTNFSIATPSGYSSYYPQICEYERKATSILVFCILSLVFCMGIGFIFEIVSIIISSKMKQFLPLSEKDLPITNPIEIDKLNNAKRKHKTGAILSSIALVITGILLFVLFMGIAIRVQTS